MPEFLFPQQSCGNLLARVAKRGKAHISSSAPPQSRIEPVNKTHFTPGGTERLWLSGAVLSDSNSQSRQDFCGLLERKGRPPGVDSDHRAPDPGSLKPARSREIEKRRLRAGRFLATQRQEVLSTLDGRRDFPQKLLQILIPLNEIDIGGIDNQ